MGESFARGRVKGRALLMRLLYLKRFGFFKRSDRVHEIKLIGIRQTFMFFTNVRMQVASILLLIINVFIISLHC